MAIHVHQYDISQDSLPVLGWVSCPAVVWPGGLFGPAPEPEAVAVSADLGTIWSAAAVVLGSYELNNLRPFLSDPGSNSTEGHDLQSEIEEKINWSYCKVTKWLNQW